MPIISAAGRWKQDVIQSLPAQLHEFQVSLDYMRPGLQKVAVADLTPNPNS